MRGEALVCYSTLSRSPLASDWTASFTTFDVHLGRTRPTVHLAIRAKRVRKAVHGMDGNI